MAGAIKAGKYRNVFAEAGFSEQEIKERLDLCFNTIFHGSDEDRFYHEAGEDMGYMEDTGNNDARTEGMSYGMMMCVQLDKKDEFDRIWKWAKTYMYLDEGRNAGFFCWSNQTDGKKNAAGAAPDGEEFFAMSLIFASHRWGDGEGIFNYSHEAKEILRHMVHQGEDGNGGQPMFDPETRYIKFICETPFTDPSYHLPHFYELYAENCYEEDKVFFKEAAAASREYFKNACHPETGLTPEYSEYDGTPHTELWYGHRHDWFYSDAYRTIGNIALDYEWFGADEWEAEIIGKYQRFFMETLKPEERDGIFSIDGTPIEGKALHPVAIISTLAQASIARDDEISKECVVNFWNTPLRKGNRRYYDNCLYMFAFMALSGNYRII